MSCWEETLVTAGDGWRQHSWDEGEEVEVTLAVPCVPVATQTIEAT